MFPVAFAEAGITVSITDARRFMGMKKIDQRLLLGRLPLLEAC